jgi:hypothetical protein
MLASKAQATAPTAAQPFNHWYDKKKEARGLPNGVML